MPDYILALDQGTTSSRSILFDGNGAIVAMAQAEHPQSYPQAGWVEHDPEALWQTQLATAREATALAGARSRDVVAMGIANQRETTILWNRATGEPVAPAIVWQDRRTSEICRELRSCGAERQFRDKTGLLLDPYFSGTKVAWLLDNVNGLRVKAERGEIAFGTVDSWLLWKLTGGRVHATDATNASRTLLFNIRTLDWDDELLGILRIPREILPAVEASSDYFGETEAEWFGTPIPICGLAGDQQAAAFGQACYRTGSVKNTYGTGSFLLMNTGTAPRPSKNGLLTTVAWTRCGESRANYALEGSIFVTGAAVQWLRDELGVVRNASETEALAYSVPDAGGVYFVPAFVGLGAPYWQPNARGAIVGLTRGSGRAHLARAALEAACYQTRDVVQAMSSDSAQSLDDMRVDGGMAINNFMLQFQADILGIPVLRPQITETTALGVAFLAGLKAGCWKSLEELSSLVKTDRVFEPQMTEDMREVLYEGWRKAVDRVRMDG